MVWFGKKARRNYSEQTKVLLCSLAPEAQSSTEPFQTSWGLEGVVLGGKVSVLARFFDNAAVVNYSG